MKKYFILSLFIAFSINVTAQNDVALQLVKQNSQAIGLSPEQLKSSIIADTYFNTFAGTNMVYLQQGHLGLPVYNQIKVLAFKNGTLVSKAGEFVNIDKLPEQTNASPATKPEDAIQTVLAAKKSSSAQTMQKKPIAGKGVKFDVGKLNVSLENITAEL